MGDPRKLRKKYSTPSHPWQKARIEEEGGLLKEYGFKNKKELWKLNSLLNKFKYQVKDLIPKNDETAQKQKKELLEKLQKLNLVNESSIIEDILAINLKDLCERRLQTLVFKKGLARSIKQARQMITHEHIRVGDKKITSPSYIVSSQEEVMITFANNSAYTDEEHPERLPTEKSPGEELKEIGISKEKPKEELTKPKREKDIEEEVDELVEGAKELNIADDTDSDDDDDETKKVEEKSTKEVEK